MTALGTRLGQWLIATVLLVVLLASLTATGVAAPLEDVVSTLFGPVQRALRSTAEPVADLIRNVDDFDRAQDENRALRNRVEQLEAENTRLREEQIRVRGREALLAVQDAQRDEIFVLSDVITRDLTGLRAVIGLNKGSDQGIEKGMPVLAAGGSLVGVVMSVQDRSAFVRLITDSDSSIRVLHQLSRTEGVVTGDTLGNLDVSFVPQITDVQPGHLFITSGLAGLLPKGLPLGRVASAEGSAQSVFKRIRLQPLAPLDSLESVLIQVTFVADPARVSDAAAGGSGGALAEDGEDGEGQP